MSTERRTTRRGGRRAKQLHLDSLRHGGKRDGAGRPRGHRVSHLARPRVRRSEPVLVTLTVDPTLPSLRLRRIYRVIREALSKANESLGMRVVHHSVQRTHIHLVVEAEDEAALARGMQGLSIRLAKAINRALERPKGRVFVDRYHARPLRSPRQVRSALAYVLNNERHHLEQARMPQYSLRQVDRCSSGAWFDGWRGRVTVPRECTGPPPHGPPRTWLLRTGWRRHGLIAPHEVPGPPAEWRRLAARL